MSASPQSELLQRTLAHGLRRVTQVGIIAMLTTVFLASIAHAECGNNGSSNIIRVGLHLDHPHDAVGQKPIAEGCWWYSGPVNVVYEAGEFKYYPTLESVDCHGPSCKRRPPQSELEIVATTHVRGTDTGTCGALPGRLLPSVTRCLPCDAFTFWASPLPAGILRPPRLTS